MKIELVNKNSDFSGPVMDIYYNDSEEAFELGVFFNKLHNSGLCTWKGKGAIRIPLVDQMESGLAVTDYPS